MHEIRKKKKRKWHLVLVAKSLSKNTSAIPAWITSMVTKKKMAGFPLMAFLWGYVYGPIDFLPGCLEPDERAESVAGTEHRLSAEKLEMWEQGSVDGLQTPSQSPGNSRGTLAPAREPRGSLAWWRWWSWGWVGWMKRGVRVDGGWGLVGHS